MRTVPAYAPAVRDPCNDHGYTVCPGEGGREREGGGEERERGGGREREREEGGVEK